MRTETLNQRRIPLALPIVAALLLAARIVWLQIPHGDEEDVHSLVKWTSISAAQELARSEHKPILYDFTAAWCAPCKQLEAQVFADEKLAARINATFVAVRVLDRQQEEGMNPLAVNDLEKRYGIEVFPTLVVSDATGAELQRMEGFRGREAFVSLLTNASRKPLGR